MSSSPTQPTPEFLLEWRRIADRLGLEFHADEPRLEGTVDGVAVTARVRWSTSSENDLPTGTRLRFVAIQAQVPAFGIQGLSIRRQGLFDDMGTLFGGSGDVTTGDAKLDRDLWIQAASPHDAAVQLRNPDILRALRPLATANGLKIASGQVRLEEHSWDADKRIQQAIEAARALAEARNAVLEAAAEALGLEARRQRIEGEVDGVAIVVRAEATANGDYEVRVAWPGPHGIRARQSEDRGGIGDPVLDSLLSFEQVDPQHALAIFGREGVRGPLLELVHGRSGEVRDGWLSTTARHEAAELMSVCTDAVALARQVAQTGPW